ncbi:hypothetical protein RI367_007351 [Sorochytrium milnesiophthora]
MTLDFTLYAGMYSGLSFATMVYSMSVARDAWQKFRPRHIKLVIISKVVMSLAFAIDGVANTYVHGILESSASCLYWTKMAEVAYRVGYSAANYVVLMRASSMWDHSLKSIVIPCHYVFWLLYLCCSIADCITLDSHLMVFPGSDPFCSYEAVSSVIYLAGAVDVAVQLYSLIFSFHGLLRRRNAGEGFRSIGHFLLGIMASYLPRAFILFVTAAMDIWITASGTYGPWVLYFWITVNLFYMIAVTFDDKTFAFVASESKSKLRMPTNGVSSFVSAVKKTTVVGDSHTAFPRP